MRQWQSLDEAEEYQAIKKWLEDRGADTLVVQEQLGRLQALPSCGVGSGGAVPGSGEVVAVALEEMAAGRGRSAGRGSAASGSSSSSSSSGSPSQMEDTVTDQGPGAVAVEDESTDNSFVALGYLPELELPRLRQMPLSQQREMVLGLMTPGYYSCVDRQNSRQCVQPPSGVLQSAGSRLSDIRFPWLEIAHRNAAAVVLQALHCVESAVGRCTRERRRGVERSQQRRGSLGFCVEAWTESGRNDEVPGDCTRDAIPSTRHRVAHER